MYPCVCVSSSSHSLAPSVCIPVCLSLLLPLCPSLYMYLSLQTLSPINFFQWGSVTHQTAVPVPSISYCVLNHHNLFYQIQNALAFNQDTCCHLALCLRLLPFQFLFFSNYSSPTIDNDRKWRFSGNSLRFRQLSVSGKNFPDLTSFNLKIAFKISPIFCSGTVFTIIPFLNNLRIGPLS